MCLKCVYLEQHVDRLFLSRAFIPLPGAFGNSDESKSQGGRATGIGGWSPGTLPSIPRAQAAPTTSSDPAPDASSSHCRTTELRVRAQPSGMVHCCCLVAQPWATLCDPMDRGPPGSSDHSISQARLLEWVAISFSRGSSRPRD